jgi:hypothetical protein
MLENFCNLSSLIRKVGEKIRIIWEKNKANAVIEIISILLAVTYIILYITPLSKRLDVWLLAVFQNHTSWDTS